MPLSLRLTAVEIICRGMTVGRTVAFRIVFCHKVSLLCRLYTQNSPTYADHISYHSQFFEWFVYACLCFIGTGKAFRVLSWKLCSTKRGRNGRIWPSGSISNPAAPWSVAKSHSSDGVCGECKGWFRNEHFHIIVKISFRMWKVHNALIISYAWLITVFVLFFFLYLSKLYWQL